MNYPMRLFTRKGIYYVQTGRNTKVSLKTRDRQKALPIFRDMEKEWLRGRLLKLENYKKKIGRAHV